MKIIYYSRGSVMPALLAAAKHYQPEATREEALQRAAAWWAEHNLAGKKIILISLDRNAAGDILYVMSALVPPGLVERTLADLSALIPDWREEGTPILVSALPFSRSGEESRSRSGGLKRRKLRALWPEVEAAVKQARLQIALKDKLP